MQLGGEEDANEGGQTEKARRADGALLALAAGQDHGGNREPLGKFVKEDGEENDDAEPSGDEETSADGDAVKKSVNSQAENDGGAHVMMADLFGVSLLAEMKMLGEDVFEEMDEEKTCQDVKERVFSGELDGFGNDFDKCYGQHVASAEGEKILQVFARPLAIDNEVAAEQIASASDETQGSCECDPT